MKSLLALVAVLVSFLLIYLVLKAEKKNRGVKKSIPVSLDPKDEFPVLSWPLYKRRLLSPPEQVLFYRLVSALPDYVILSQVQMVRFLGVKKGNDFSSWFNRVNRMSVDFLVCTKSFDVVSVIELDDKSHNRSDRRDADAKKDLALRDAGVKIVRWNVNALPNDDQILAEVFEGNDIEKENYQSGGTI